MTVSDKEQGARSQAQRPREGVWDVPAQEDISEAETLRRLARMEQFNRWLWGKVEPWVGQRVLEIGCGLGNFTGFLADREKVVGVDMSQQHLRELRERHPELAGVELHCLDAGDPKLVNLGAGQFDSVVCLNVLEHVQQDQQAIRSFHTLLEPGGHLVLLVPAFPSLFGTLDLNGPHYRRYTRETIRTLLTENGFEVLRMQYFNLFGIPGWWFCGKVLRRPILPSSGLGWYERLLPLFRRIEEWTGPLVGLSLIVIGRKTHKEAIRVQPSGCEKRHAEARTLNRDRD